MSGRESGGAQSSPPVDFPRLSLSRSLLQPANCRKPITVQMILVHRGANEAHPLEHHLSPPLDRPGRTDVRVHSSVSHRDSLNSPSGNIFLVLSFIELNTISNMQSLCMHLTVIIFTFKHGPSQDADRWSLSLHIPLGWVKCHPPHPQKL